MTQEEIIKGNKLIAEFMGHKKAHKASSLYRNVTSINFMSGELQEFNYGENQLKYHLSFDWLMPVAKKCIDSYHDMRFDIFQALDDVNINKLWVSCVNFIQWYNLQTPSK